MALHFRQQNSKQFQPFGGAVLDTTSNKGHPSNKDWGGGWTLWSARDNSATQNYIYKLYKGFDLQLDLPNAYLP